MNYSVDAYNKETMRVGPSKTEKAPRVPRAPKQINLQEFQFFPERLHALQEREYNAYRKEHGVPATIRDAQGKNVTPEELEAERDVEQKRIDEAEPLTEEEVAEKDELISQGFENWSRRDFQQFDGGFRTPGERDRDKTAADVAEYYRVFQEKWESLSEYERIAQRKAEGEVKRNKQNALENMLAKKVQGALYPMQELELNYPTTKEKIYSEEEDRNLLCRLHQYGLKADDVYERIKKDITELPVFRFDWFFKSRTPQELQCRCNTLLGLIKKEAEQEQQGEAKAKGGARGKKHAADGTTGWEGVPLELAAIHEDVKEEPLLYSPPVSVLATVRCRWRT
ncbi:slide-domain-containing protein [Phellopilus nigrolimitatus]|nr:slide-domain-containing protein [Phellopilus nigrolimitatus]